MSMPRRMPSIPTAADLVTAVSRAVLTGALFVGAALLSRSAGAGDSVRPYAAMAAACLPQLLLCALALLDKRRRERLRLSRRPMPVFVAVAVVLAVVGLAEAARTGSVSMSVWAAALAVVACLVSAVPPVVSLPLRGRI